MRTFTCPHCGQLVETTGLRHDVEAFHIKFNQSYSDGPRNLTKDEREFRLIAMREEIDEYQRACEERDLNKQLDALIDAMYFIQGTAYRQGFGNIWNEAWRRVHDKNMQKELTTKLNPSKRGAFNQYDIVKPEGWTPPDHSDLLPKPEAPVEGAI